MNKFRFCVTITLLSSNLLQIATVNLSDAIFKPLSLALAVSEVVDKDFSTGVKTTNLITPDRQNYKIASESLLTLNFATIKTAFRQDSASKLSTIYGRRKRYVILAIENFEQFLEIHSRMFPTFFRFSGLYLVVLVNGAIREIQEIFKFLWRIQVYNVNIMFDVNGTILIETFMPFKATNCNDTSPVLIDTFKNGKFLHNQKKLFPDKMKNLQNCPIRVSLSNSSEPFIIVKYLEDGSHHISGHDYDLIVSLSKALNFKINVTFIGDVGHVFENGSAKGPLKVLMDGDADFSVSGWYIKQNRLKFFDATNTYISGEIKFVIPPKRDLSAIEKLVFPFTPPSWIMVSTCLLVGLLLIFTVKRRSKSIQSFIFGAGIKKNYLNMYIAFIGGTQQILPKTNFARYLLMLFLMYSLVIRTLYQGSYYQLMQSGKHHNVVSSIDEMIQKNFIFYIAVGIVDLFQGHEALSKRFWFLKFFFIAKIICRNIPEFLRFNKSRGHSTCTRYKVILH